MQPDILELKILLSETIVRAQLELAHHVRKHHVELGVRKLDADALARAVGEAGEEAVHAARGGGIEPAGRLECVAIWEDGLVVVERIRVHADDGLGGELIRFGRWWRGKREEGGITPWGT